MYLRIKLLLLLLTSKLIYGTLKSKPEAERKEVTSAYLIHQIKAKTIIPKTCLQSTN